MFSISSGVGFTLFTLARPGIPEVDIISRLSSINITVLANTQAQTLQKQRSNGAKGLMIVFECLH